MLNKIPAKKNSPKKSAEEELISTFNQLIELYNQCSENENILRIFYLQKINYLLNKSPMNTKLFNWVNAPMSKEGSWHAVLSSYGIHPNASFLLKDFQFAKAVAENKAEPMAKKMEKQDIYQLRQKRDTLLTQESLSKEQISQFHGLCMQILALAEEPVLAQKIEKHKKILSFAQKKIDAIKGHTKEVSPAYKTKALGSRQANNFNYQFEMGQWKTLKKWKKMVFRVEDRAHWGIDQHLFAFPVSEYFSDDAAMFMMEFKKDKNLNTPMYKPVVLGQFAKQRDLEHVARMLRNKPIAEILQATKNYFSQLSDFLLRLKAANVYHPDIKLSNFLLHKEKLIVSDRKAFVRGAKNHAGENLRTTPQYAPTEFLNVLINGQFKASAAYTYFDMEPFTSFQIGLALKEFLILTQLKKVPKPAWVNNFDLSLYFKDSNHEIGNLALLVIELTRTKIERRLSLEHFNELLPLVAQPLHVFIAELEKRLPGEDIGIPQTKELSQLFTLRATNPNDERYQGKELLNLLSPIFLSLPLKNNPNPRLLLLGQQLAIPCYYEYGRNYFLQLAKKIDQAVWDNAPWYKKMVHVLSFGLIDVASMDDVAKLQVDVDFKEIQPYYSLIQFLSPEEGKDFTKSYLGDFLYTHLDKLDAKYQKSEEKVSAAVVDQSTFDERHSLSISTTQVNEQKEENTQDNAATAEDRPELSSTMVIASEEPEETNKSNSTAPEKKPKEEPQKELKKKDDAEGSKAEKAKASKVGMFRNRSLHRVDSIIKKGEKRLIFGS